MSVCVVRLRVFIRNYARSDLTFFSSFFWVSSSIAACVETVVV